MTETMDPSNVLVDERISLLGSINDNAADSLKSKVDDNAVGHKTIGRWSSFVYIINQIFGPGVLAIPIVFQQAGWVIVSIVMAFFMILSGWSATLLIDAMRMIPGNSQFEKRYEYATIVKYYLGHKAYILSQIALNICLQSLNIASIIVVAQSMDSLLVFCFKKSFALEFFPHFQFISGGDSAISLWYSNQVFVITLGYIIVMCLCIPMGVVNLDDNIKFQWVSLVGLCVLMLQFTAFYIFESPFYFDEVQAFGSEYKQVVSVFIFSWAYIMLVPSWANEKKEHVSINKTIWISAFSSTVGYLSMGLLGALSFRGLVSDDILKKMSGPNVFILTRICAYLFSLLIISPGIPVYCITTRYNLYIGGVCGKKWANFWGVVAPWMIGFIFTQGPIFAQLLNWTALLFSGIINFILPLLLWIIAYRARMEREAGSGVHFIPEHTATESAFPKFLRPHAVIIAIAMLCIISVLIITQIGLDLYYLIALKQNLVS